MSARRRMVAVIGAGVVSSQTAVLAESVGKALVDQGFRIITGGLGGVMAAASRGARSSANYSDGDVVAIVPGDSAEAANAHVDIVIVSGMGVARNVLLVRSADAVVAVAGGAGTLSELAVAWQLDKPIVAIGDQGWSGRLAGERIDERQRPAILHALDAHEAMELLCQVLAH